MHNWLLEIRHWLGSLAHCLSLISAQHKLMYDNFNEYPSTLTNTNEHSRTAIIPNKRYRTFVSRSGHPYLPNSREREQFYTSVCTQRRTSIERFIIAHGPAFSFENNVLIWTDRSEFVYSVHPSLLSVVEAASLNHPSLEQGYIIKTFLRMKSLTLISSRRFTVFLRKLSLLTPL